MADAPSIPSEAETRARFVVASQAWQSSTLFGPVRRLLLVSALATSASCASGATSGSAVGLNDQVVVFLAAMIDDQARAKSMIHEVRSMEFQSGRTKVSDFSAFSAASKKFRNSELQLRGADALLLMTAPPSSSQPCADRLSVNFYPAGDRLDVTYAVESNAVCSQPVEQVVPAPASDATGR